MIFNVTFLEYISIFLYICSGCVIAEIRDHRNNSETTTTNDSILSHYVLLRPSTQSLICDGNLICERSNLHSKEDRIHVESQLCLATQGPLCLDPDPVVSIIARCVHIQHFINYFLRSTFSSQSFVLFAGNHVFDAKNLPLQR